MFPLEEEGGKRHREKIFSVGKIYCFCASLAENMKEFPGENRSCHREKNKKRDGGFFCHFLLCRLHTQGEFLSGGELCRKCPREEL